MLSEVLRFGNRFIRPSKLKLSQRNTHTLPPGLMNILKSTPIEWLKKTTYNNTNQMMSNADWKQLALTAITDNCRKTRQRLL
ncbi:MAG: hypothetical protein ACON35_01540, partial [Candidatus Marinamargulisbacteria bacterium]